MLEEPQKPKEADLLEEIQQKLREKAFRKFVGWVER
jgi:hypothetical protein